MRSHSTSVDADALERTRGRYLIRETLLKAHAACQLTHGSIENAVGLQRDHGFAADAVTAMRFEIAASSAPICDIVAPRTGLEARFSLRTVVAMALLGHDTAMPEGYDAAVRAPDVTALRTRATVSGNPTLDVPISRAWITLADGRVLERTSDERATLPDADERVRRASRKFHRLTAARLAQDTAHHLEATILAIERLERIGTLTDLAATSRD